MHPPRSTQTLYILTGEDGDRIDHLIGVLATAVAEMLVAKRIKVPKTPDLLPAEDQLMNENNDLSGAATQAEGATDDD